MNNTAKKYKANTKPQYKVSQRTTELMAIIDVQQQLMRMCNDFEDKYKHDELADCTSVIGFELDDVDTMLAASIQLDIADRRLNA